MSLRYIPLCVLLAGCSVEKTEFSPDVQPFSQAVVQGDRNGSNSISLRSSQPAPYADIIDAKYAEMQFGFDDNVRSLEISRLAANQARLPQVTPGARLDSEGELGLNLSFSQVLFDGGVYKATYAQNDHLSVLRQIQLLSELNEKAAYDISVYLSYWENTERHALLLSLSEHLSDLSSLAQTRANGGIGSASDSSLFLLKLSEIETDASIAELDAKADHSIIEHVDVKVKPVGFNVSEKRLPLAVVEAMARRDTAASALTVAQREAIPQVSVDASAGINLATGLPTMNAGINVESKPLRLGGDTNILKAQQKLKLAEHELERDVRETERENKKINNRMGALNMKLEKTEQLAAQAEKRFEAFTKEFRAGTAGLTEAVGILETLRQSLETELDLKYELLALQLQLAQAGGYFWNLNKGT